MPLRDVYRGLARARSLSLVPPAADARLERALWAIVVHVVAARLAWADPATRQHLRRAWALQVPLFVMLSLCGISALGLGLMDPTSFTEAGEPRQVEVLSAIIGVLKVTEWCVVALTRQFSEAVTLSASKALGLPSSEAVSPRVRVDARWLWNRVQRRIKAGLALLVSSAPAWLMTTTVLVPVVRAISSSAMGASDGAAEWLAESTDEAASAVLAVAWVGIFTLGRSDQAWTLPSPPDFVLVRQVNRLGDAVRARAPVLAGLLRPYAWLLERVTRFMRSPAECAARARWETAGLILVRVIVSFPGAYLVLRPLVPVTSSLILAARVPEAFGERSRPDEPAAAPSPSRS